MAALVQPMPDRSGVHAFCVLQVLERSVPVHCAAGEVGYRTYNCPSSWLAPSPSPSLPRSYTYTCNGQAYSFTVSCTYSDTSTDPLHCALWDPNTSSWDTGACNTTAHNAANLTCTCSNVSRHFYPSASPFALHSLEVSLVAPPVIPLNTLPSRTTAVFFGVHVFLGLLLLLAWCVVWYANAWRLDLRDLHEDQGPRSDMASSPKQGVLAFLMFGPLRRRGRRGRGARVIPIQEKRPTPELTLLGVGVGEGGSIARRPTGESLAMQWQRDELKATHKRISPRPALRLDLNAINSPPSVPSNGGATVQVQPRSPQHNPLHSPQPETPKSPIAESQEREETQLLCESLPWFTRLGKRGSGPSVVRWLTHAVLRYHPTLSTFSVHGARRYATWSRRMKVVLAVCKTMVRRCEALTLRGALTVERSRHAAVHNSNK